MENKVKEEPKKADEASSKITSFFPVLRSEGRAKMCSSKVGDQKQKEILQKMINNKDASPASKAQMKKPAPEVKVSERVRSNMLSSALKTPLSQVLRKNIGNLDSRKDEKRLPEKTTESDNSAFKSSRTARKSFVDNKKIIPALKQQSNITPHSAKIFTSTSRSSTVKKTLPAQNSSNISKSKNNSVVAAAPVSVQPEPVEEPEASKLELVSPPEKGVESPSTETSDSKSNQKNNKKNKKRHFRGGTYGLFLTPARKRKKKQKSSPDSGSKDDECSLAGTENSSYIDSDDGNSLVSDDFNTPSEKSLADEEPDSRTSPILSSADPKTEIKDEEAERLPDQKILEPSIDDKAVGQEEGDSDATKMLESLADMQWLPDSNESEKVDGQFDNILKAPEYDDISNESFSNSSGFPFGKKSLFVGDEESQKIVEQFEENELFNLENVGDKDSHSNSALNVTAEQNIDGADSSLNNDPTDVPESTEDKEIAEEQQENDSEMMEHNISDDLDPDNSHYLADGDDLNYDDKDMTDASLSTIATSVKSRQRTKRRFTDDIIDTDVGLLSLNTNPALRKSIPKADIPKDSIDSFLFTTISETKFGPNEAKHGPLTKLECIYNNRQPLINTCTCEGETIAATMDDDEVNDAYCQAVDSIDDKLVGCCNPVVTTDLVRPSQKIPFTVMCEIHLWRLRHHHSCPYCGLFCSQGNFMQCSSKQGNKKIVHIFHERCQIKEEGHIPFCLHCGSTEGLKVVELEMHMSTPPAFYLSQKSSVSIMKARITFNSVPSCKAIENGVCSEKTFTIVKSGKVLSSVGLPTGSSKTELEGLLESLSCDETENENEFTLEDFYTFTTKGDIPKVVKMLALGFDPNYKFPEHDYETALHVAAAEGHLVIVHLLIQAGAINDCLNEKIYTPLMLATESDHKDIAHYLVLKGAMTDFRGESGMTSIHLSAKSGNLELLKILMTSRKIDVNAQDDGGWTPIVWASEHDHYDVVKYLLERGANPNIKDNEGNTGLHWSAFSGSVDICFLYLDYGCEVNAVNEHGDTPLHIAARQDSIACVTLFLARGANVQALNKANRLPAECCNDKNGRTYLSLSLNMLLKKVTSKYQHKVEKILHRDISRGKEQIAIQCVNSVDDEPPPCDFLYVTENCETMPINIDRTITSLQSCHCEDDCTSSVCTCAQISFKCWYDKEGCLQPDFNMLDPPMLFECNRACSCWSLNCNNRVLQGGINVRLQLIRTNGKGWGVRTLKDIPKGTFICEYIGELISDSEADKREDDSYLFDLDNRDGETYCLDARYYGNISRFINHLCEPNLVPVKVFVDHQDLSFPRIAFFSSREIKQYEELGFDYGEKFWSIKYKWFTCDCGTPKCKYSKDSIHETLAVYYRRLKEEQFEEAAHMHAV